jgi:hypothetical protein
VAVIYWLGQAPACPQSSVLPPDYLQTDDAAYLPGVAPEPALPPPAPPQRASVLLPIGLGVAVVALYWVLRR